MLKSIGSANLLVRMPGKGRPKEPGPRELMVRSKKQALLEDKVSLNRKPVESPTYGGLQSVQVTSDYILLRNLVLKILEEQGVAVRVDLGDSSINIRDLTPAEAQELISEDGYLGVEQTSDRIVQFAISAAGNDPEKLELIKASIDEGFEMASEALGGVLPEISMRTYDAIMQKLDAWAENKEGGHL